MLSSPTTLCSYCPRRCNADRTLGQGWCRTDDRIHVASLVLHRGEEPPLSGQRGIVNLFFPSCNMECLYCQNHQISGRGMEGTVVTLEEICDSIIELLPFSEGNLGFVSPGHFIPQMTGIIERLWSKGHHPVIVYNSNGYDLPETIRYLEGYVDVWLPDFKYSDDSLAVQLSAAPGYSAYALASLKEMVRQCGVTLQTDENEIAQRGVIVRHLVLPGAADNSIGVLKLIAEEISPNLHISLMSQYFPPQNSLRWHNYIESQRHDSHHNSLPALTASLSGTITQDEYQAVVTAFRHYGFSRGWLQEYESNMSYRPDFTNDKPFSD